MATATIKFLARIASRRPAKNRRKELGRGPMATPAAECFTDWNQTKYPIACRLDGADRVLRLVPPQPVSGRPESLNVEHYAALALAAQNNDAARCRGRFELPDGVYEVDVAIRVSARVAICGHEIIGGFAFVDRIPSADEASIDEDGKHRDYDGPMLVPAE